jgi:integrase
MLKRFASELLDAGVPEAEITSVAALCDPVRAERGLRGMVARNGGGTNAVIADMSSILCSYARRFGFGEDAIKRLSWLKTRLARPPQPGMTAKNRERLRPLQDEATLSRLLDLPRLLVKKAAKMPPRTAALAREDALAISLLLTCPVRIKNLAGIRLDTYLHRPGDGLVFIAIEAEDVKNLRPIEFALPRDVLRKLDQHVATRTPLLCPPGTPWLFPRRDGTGPVNLPAFSTRLSKRIRKETGLAMNPHLFRHLSAMVWLSSNPGAYEVASRLLGHSSVSTTMKFYAGHEARAAIAAFGELIAAKRKRK